VKRLRLLLLFALISADAFAQPAAPPAASPFEGTWLGEIAAPDTHTTLGLAFTRTERGLLVSLYFPEMFLYSVNFGPAEIHGDVFELPPLNLSLTLAGDRLTGTFALAKLPVELRRGGEFAPAPPAPDFPPPPAPAWSRALGAAAWASPIARDGIVYVGTVDGKLHALRAADAADVWTWSGPNPLYGAALASADSIFVIDERGDLVRLNRATGELVWRTALHHNQPAGAPLPANPTFNHRAPTPALDEKKGILYVGSSDGGLYAIRERNGKVLWRVAAPAPIFAPVTIHANDVIAACFDGTVFAINRRTRKPVLRATLDGPLVSAPVVAGDRIVIGSRDYLLYGLDAQSGRVAWRDSFWFSWVESTPAPAGGILYIGGSDFRRVSAIDPVSGRRVWATDVRGLSWGTPVVVGDTVFAGTVGQNLAGTVIHHTGGIIALDRQSGAVRWRYVSPVPPQADFVGFAGSLVESDGRIIGAAVDGTLIAFPVSS
jgi:outer membrane protein assembly factor BamB